MARVDAHVDALGRLADDPLRPDVTDDPRDVAAQVEGRFEPAVGVAEEVQVGDTDDLGRGGLLRAGGSPPSRRAER